MRRILNLPNMLTLLRILFLPVFVFVYFMFGKEYSMIPLFFIGISDVLDGHIARKYNQITLLGQILDPIADKLVQTTVLVCMLIRNLVPVWFFIGLIIKELLMLIGGYLLLYRKETLPMVKWYGKAATGCFYAAVLSVFAFEYGEPYKTIVYLFAFVCAMYSFFNYLFTARKSTSLLGGTVVAVNSDVNSNPAG